MKPIQGRKLFTSCFSVIFQGREYGFSSEVLGPSFLPPSLPPFLCLAPFLSSLHLFLSLMPPPRSESAAYSSHEMRTTIPNFLHSQ